MRGEAEDRASFASDAAAVRPEPGHFLKSALDPIERISEILFGLIMVLTFTGSLEVATAGRAGVRAMLLGALGCNLAWGVIDGCMYMMARLHERGRRLMVLRAVRDATNLDVAQAMIAEALPPLIASLLPQQQLELLRVKLQRLPEPPRYVLPERREWLGAVAVCVLVFFSTIPVLIPFVFITNVTFALRTSNAIAVTMMFVLGCAFGYCTGFRPLRIGVSMVFAGVVLVALAIALGG